MATITEDYCSFEVAKLLKEKGFDETCYACYEYFSSSVTMYSGWPFEYKGEVVNNSKDRIKCPTIQMAMKWLREEKGIHITACISYDISTDADGNEVDRWTFWFFEIFSSISGNLIYLEEFEQYDSHEEAAEAALKYSLENLI